MSEQTDTTCWFLLRSKSVGRNVSLSTDKDLSETIFRSFSSFLSLSLPHRIETNWRIIRKRFEREARSRESLAVTITSVQLAIFAR